MKKLLFPLVLAILGASCGAVDSAKEKASTSLAESMIEKATGQKVDMPDANNVKKNKVYVKLKMGDEDLEAKFKEAFGSITGSKETIAITAQVEKDQKATALMLSFTGKDLTQLKPIKGSVDSKNESEAKMMIMLSTYSENGVESIIAKEGTAEIVSISDNKIVIKIKGKMCEAQDIETPAKWKDIEGTVVFDYPVFTTLGIKKNEIQY